VGPREKFELLAAMALVDRQLQPPEQEVLLRSAHGLGMPREEAVGIVQSLMQGKPLGGMTPPSDPAEKQALFQELIGVILADGQVSPAEQQTLQSLAPQFGVDPGQIPQILAQAAGGAATGAVAAAGGVSLAAPGGGAAPKKKKARRPKPGEAGCPSCGAPVEFKNSRSVAAVCEYCDTTVVRQDAEGALEDLGKISHIVPDASPIRIGARGECFGIEFTVIGRLQVEHATGYWNEWFIDWADHETGWLGEALGQYLVTFPGGEKAGKGVPPFDELKVGQKLFIAKKRYTIAEVRMARATGTEGETPFAAGEGYELPYADLRRSDDGFATIDYSEDDPLVFTGRCVGWKDLHMRGFRKFEGW